jgi:protocatechuate 3,4-dioxygenase beta subunit
VKGEPARGVVVSIQPQQYLTARQPTILRVKTDSGGRFRFTGVTAGNYSVTAIAPAFSAPGGAGFGARSKAVNVAEGETVEDIAIDLKPGGVITGRVTDPQGLPLTDHTVTLMTVNKDGSRQQYSDYSNGDMLVIDDRGVYRIYGLPEGRYLVGVGVPTNEHSSLLLRSRSYYPFTYHPDTTDESKAKVIEVTEGSEATGVDITVGDLKKTFEIFGRVVNADTGQAAPDIALGYGLVAEGGRGLIGQGSKGERSDAKGEFQLSSILPGKYAVYARPDGDSDFYGEPTICDATQGTVRGVEVKVRQGASISGFVVIEGSNDPALLSKLSQMTLFARSNSDQFSIAGKGPIKVYSNGGFQARGLQPGKVDFFMQTIPTLGLTKLRLEANGAPQSDGIELRAGQHLSDVRFVVGYSAGVLRGQVKILGGVIPDTVFLSVSANRVDQPSAPPISGRVDARGQFSIENMPPGTYELRPFVYGRSPEDPQIARLRRLFSPVMEVVVVSNNNEAHATLVVDISRKGGSIRGQLKVEGGVIPAEFVVAVYAMRMGSQSGTERALVDAQGQFGFEDLTPGEYLLRLDVASRVRTDERVPQLAPMIRRAQARVVVSDGSETQATLLVNLSQ